MSVDVARPRTEWHAALAYLAAHEADGTLPLAHEFAAMVIQAGMDRSPHPDLVFRGSEPCVAFIRGLLDAATAELCPASLVAEADRLLRS